MDRSAVMDDDAHARFQALFEAHRGIVLKIASSYAWNADDRADLAQEIGMQLWRAFPGYDDSRSFSTWMYRVALNVAISSLRSESARRRRTVPLDERHDLGDPQSADPDASQRVRALETFLQKEHPLDRALLVLYLEERSHKDIAEILGISETNVATKIGRLKQRMRDEV